MSTNELVSTVKGSQMLIHGGHTWTEKQLCQDGTKVWLHLQVVCQVSIINPLDEEQRWHMGERPRHRSQHDPDPNAVIKCRAAVAGGANIDTMQNAIAQTMGNTPVTDHVVLSESRLRRTVYSAKKRHARPTTRITGCTRLWKHWCCHQECLRIVENPSSSETQVLTKIAWWLLRLPRHLQSLEQATCILGDGTFQTTPNRWKQQHSLHANVLHSCAALLGLWKDQCFTISCCASPPSWLAVSRRNHGCLTFRPP